MAERHTFLQKEVGFCRKRLVSAEIVLVLAETLCFLLSAEINSFGRYRQAILQKVRPFCRKAAYLQNLPFLQKVTEMQRHFGLISAPSKSAETKIFLLSVDLY